MRKTGSKQMSAEEYLESMDCEKNEYGNYIYSSSKGNSRMNLVDILNDFSAPLQDEIERLRENPRAKQYSGINGSEIQAALIGKELKDMSDKLAMALEGLLTNFSGNIVGSAKEFEQIQIQQLLSDYKNLAK